ncbi:MAG: hypothetical protein JWO06_2553 [Bacteroidota bacterium]|nr:hypothetical protein [Bacteroidota bacterium]
MAKYRGLALAITLTAILWLVFFSHELFNADHIIYGGYGGDGIKNYYTLAYYLAHDSGSHFSGMNYPYGENIPFTDNQPALAWLLKPLIKIFPAIIDHLRFILISLIFVSVIIAATYTFKSLRILSVAELPAVLFTALITLLSPQIQRMGGHFSLAYICFLPVIIYLLIRFFQTNGGAKYFLWLIFTLTLFSFIHIYYLAMTGMYIMLIAFLFSLYNLMRIKNHLKFVLLLIASVLIPFFILKTYLFFTDCITDRPTAPWGFVMSRSTIADILINANSFTGKLLINLFPNASVEYHYEGMGYIGLVATVTLIPILIARLRKKSDSIWLFPYPFNFLFPSAIGVLLFAMAIPFCFEPFEKYYDLMPGIIKQFRASGRFNWIFYYTTTLLVAVILYRIFNALLNKNKIGAYSFLILIALVWFAEINMVCNFYAKTFKASGVEFNELKETKEFLNALQSSGKGPSDFQAIFPLPLFLNGSEKIYLQSCAEFATMKVSLFTGLPIICGEMSRTSLIQSLKIANLLSNDLLNKEILKEYPDRKALLLVAQGGFSDQEQKLVDRANFLFSSGNIRYYELPLTAFNDSASSAKNYFSQNKQQLFAHQGYLSNDSVANVVIQDYETEPKDYAVFGHGAHYNYKDSSILFDDTLPGGFPKALYEFSIWMYADRRVPAFPAIVITQLDSLGKKEESYSTEGKYATNTFGKWVRCQIDFELRNRHNRICITGYGNYATYDDFLIRPKTVNVISEIKNDSMFSFNNFPIR